jgi:hypothetical protein
MMEPNPLTRFDAPWMRELRHLANLGGWVHADYFDGSSFQLIGDELRQRGYIVPGQRDGRATYELTDAGRAWCRENSTV